MSKIWSMIRKGIKAIFCRETVSKVWTILFNGGKSTVGCMLSNAELMNAAFEYAKALSTRHTSSEEKKTAFDDLLKSYLSSKGIEVGTSIINVIRETALAAVNAESEQKS